MQEAGLTGLIRVGEANPGRIQTTKIDVLNDAFLNLSY